MVLMESVQSPQEFLQDLKFDGSRCITVTSDRLSWSFYFDYGKLAYAHCSLESFERLERHLRSLKREAPNLTDQVRSQLRHMFGDAATEREDGVHLEYLAVCWLVQEQYLTKGAQGDCPLDSRSVRDISMFAARHLCDEAPRHFAARNILCCRDQTTHRYCYGATEVLASLRTNHFFTISMSLFSHPDPRNFWCVFRKCAATRAHFKRL
jgi:hypothetical protein